MGFLCEQSSNIPVISLNTWGETSLLFNFTIEIIDVYKNLHDVPRTVYSEVCNRTVTFAQTHPGKVKIARMCYFD